ncbi:phosphorylase family protein [Lentzea sp. HUAS TT2]|uniref:phosphorylase family protein n=1 Tax=Lentzea sp. HUAS TT2 TaxID=3447454 RepID=UPI003F6E8997
MGATAVPMVAGEAIRLLKPHYAIITGICYGLYPDAQELDDVLVYALIRDLDHAKLMESGGDVIRRDRGPNVDPSPVLQTAAKAAQSQWQQESEMPVHFGKILSWNKLLNARIVTDELRQRYPSAIGGDIEGMGFHSVTRWADVLGILIKGICDWGHDKADEHHAVAAANSAGFALHLVRIGGLSGIRRTYR